MPVELATEIKSFCRDPLGFDLVGFTSAEPLAGATHLREWVAAGCHGEMGYMAETVEVRADPRRFLPEARSVVCVAMSYHDPAPEPDRPIAPGGVAVARYAQRRDYHKVIRPRLVRLGRFIAERAPGTEWRVAADTAPLLEKELAQRAGLGWIGKNACLINRRLGSELLLGELVTSLELPPDRPEADHCGTCRACLDACPTAAFDGPRRLDSRRCVSYLTIEHRTAIPEVLLPALGAHLFGCDLCQAVCPWNRRAEASCTPALAPRPRLRGLTLGALDALDAAGWNAMAAGTPLRRLDHPRLRRNLAAIAASGGAALSEGRG